MSTLWDEIRMSITEFVQFCTRMFGNDLSSTWIFIDSDNSGEINFEEWCQSLHELSYFGPVAPIFRYLDADNEGSISNVEFMELEKFRPAAMKRVEHLHTRASY